MKIHENKDEIGRKSGVGQHTRQFATYRGFIIKSAIMLFFCLLSYSCQQSSPTQQPYDVAAYIWPAFHDDARWHEINLFPDGKGEWESIYNAEPKFEGHRQPRTPLWGYFDEADPKMQERIIDTATEYGVNTFIFDWYWYDNKPFLEAPLNAFLKAKNTEKMKFYLMWANHTANSYWDRHEADKSKVYWRGEVTREIFEGFADHLINDYFKKPNYYRIDGKPVFAIYELSTFINGMGGMKQAKEALEDFRNKCVAAGLPGLHLQGILWGKIPASLDGVPGDTDSTQDNTIRYLGFNSLTNYQWCHFVPLKEYEAWGEEATEKYEQFANDFTVPYFPHVSVDWDNNPRFPGKEAQKAVTGVTPDKFKKFLLKARQFADNHPQQTPLITINAWNEWSEGSYLEPDTEYEYGFLQAVKDVFIGLEKQ